MEKGAGSIQEETNSLGVPGVVLRFNSDRPEAIFAGSNILAPPICSKAIIKIIKAVVEKLYATHKYGDALPNFGDDAAVIPFRVYG